MFWPSYLEDAVNLPDIRMNEKEIEDFKKNIIPEMRRIIANKIKNEEIVNNIEKSLSSYYNDGTNYMSIIKRVKIAIGRRTFYILS